MSTTIEWTDNTWNPTTGCTRASEGCDLCYAFQLTKRLDAFGMEKYKDLVNPGKNHFNGTLKTHNDALDLPIKRRKQTKWFVNSMSDLFHAGAPFEFIAVVFGVMACCPQHVFQVLTKRPENMVAFFNWLSAQVANEGTNPAAYCIKQAKNLGVHVPSHTRLASAWPLPNVWLGTSVELEAYAGRVETLSTVPAAKRFISAEPLLGPVNLHGSLRGSIDWVIVGGESGKGARPMERAWAADIQDACQSEGAAYFLKQLGKVEAKRLKLKHAKGGDASEWPADWLAIGDRSFPA